jgi:hypothetical protein
MERTLSELMPVARKLMQEYPVLSDWGDETLAIWLRDDCRCVYCGVDMLQGRHHFVNLQQREHLLPACQYPTLAKCPENIVLCCASCNSFKARWDPNKQAVGEPQLIADGVRSITNHDRSQLVWRTRQHLRAAINRSEKSFWEQREVILDAIYKIAESSPSELNAAAGG